MAISFVGSYVGTHSSTSAQSIALSNLRDESNAQPTLQSGDIILVAVNNASTVNRPEGSMVPTGYTNILPLGIYVNDSNDVNFQLSYKIMGPTPDTTISIPASNATTAGVAFAIVVLRGVDTTTPMDVAATEADSNNSGIANPPAITPATNGAWIVGFGAAAVAAGAVFTNPAGSGWSTATNHFRSATITTTTNDANICVSLKNDWTSGEFDPPAYGGSTSTNTGSWAAGMVALRPAPVVVPRRLQARYSYFTS